MLPDARVVLEHLLPAPIVVEHVDPGQLRDPEAELFEEERVGIARAVEKRRREFAAGRILARRGMAALGHPPAAIVNGEDRAPQWPAGIVGSITHTKGYCAVAMARSSELRSVAIDAERDDALSGGALEMICSEAERAWLLTRPEGERGWLSKLVFSAKESVYKLQHPLTKLFLDFDAVTVHVDLERETWTATFLVPAAPAFDVGDRIEGRWRHADGIVATAAWLR